MWDESWNRGAMLRPDHETEVRQVARGFVVPEIGSGHASHDNAVFLYRVDHVQWNASGVPRPSSNAGQIMTDIVDRTVRSRMMAGIGGKDTKPELILRRELHARGFRYRLHDRKLPGTPDMVFRRFAAVCFVHGCFWHRHEGCPYTTEPATRPDFWQAKFRSNVERDHRAREKLLGSGWRVAIVWECALRGERVERTSLRLDQWLHGEEQFFETDLDWNR